MTGSDAGGAPTSSSVGARRRRPEPSPTQRALGLLTRREHSQKELHRKLTARGVESDVAHTVVEKLTAAGWQSETRFAESLLRSRASSGYGEAYIRAELAMHGLDSSTIAAAFDGCEQDWDALAADLVRRRHPQALTDDFAAQRKATAFLLRRGFSMEQARRALRNAD